MKVITKKIQELREKYEKDVKDLLMGKYPYLYFYISPTGNITVWVRRNGKDGAAIPIPSINLYMFDEEFFDELNQKIKPASLEPDKYFQCSECGEVKPISEYFDFVMASDYCLDCSRKNDVRKLIEESKKNGFYD